jgi:alpha-amylase
LVDYRSGDEYFAAPNIDHSNGMVRSQLKEWMKWMREFIGYDGFRFDFVKGYSGNFTQEYVDASVPRLSIGEFWDACDYSDGVLAYNQVGTDVGSPMCVVCTTTRGGRQYP